MKHLLVLLCLAAALAVAPLGTPAQAQTYDSPQAVLYAYYNAVNLRDYWSAYNLRNNPSQRYEQFAAGFSDTLRIEPYLGGFQPAGGTDAYNGRQPSVLIAYRVDGTRATFWGCFNVSLLRGGWRITGANLRLLTEGVVDSVTLTSHLAINCYAPLPVLPMTLVDRLGDAAAFDTLFAYYDLVNARSYPAAYGYWLQPLPGPQPNGAPARDYRAPYTQFVNGYQDTVYVNLYVDRYRFGGASAGKPYLHGLMPAVLVGQHSDGSFVTYYGCYSLGMLGTSPTGLGIIDGDFKLLLAGAPTADTFLPYLQGDCSGLNLGT